MKPLHVLFRDALSRSSWGCPYACFVYAIGLANKALMERFK